MSAADIAVQVFRKLEPEDFRVLLAIELAMVRYEYVPENSISKLANILQREIQHRLPRLEKSGLVRLWTGAYTGYALNYAGYDCLAINAFVKAGLIEAFGKPLGVGKESDVYDALTPSRKRVAIKFHRLGRISFRQTRRKRGYVAQRRHISWLYQSRLSAETEFKALGLAYSHGVAVPEPGRQNRHAIVMGMIDGAELLNYNEIPEPQKVLDEILLSVRKTYLDAGIIHADLSEYNIILKPDWHILIIDWPQFVRKDHPNAEQLLSRDVGNVVRFFNRKFGTKMTLKDALTFVSA